MVAKFLKGIIRKRDSGYIVEPTMVNQSSGAIIRHSKTREIIAVFVFELEDAGIQNIYAILNPDKLKLVK
ncbi:MAG: hypothetical protein ACPGVB_12830 [Chitinophagales bacterium]